MKNLTKFQQRLIDDLTKEFLSLNPNDSGGSVANKKFSMATIDACINEEERLKKSMSKHNNLMAKTFLGQLEGDIKGFEEEFGSVLRTQTGYHVISHTDGPTMYSTKEEFIEKRERMNLYLVSKVKEHSGSDAYARKCQGMQYIEIVVKFKTELITTTLDSGKEVRLRRIIGLAYYASRNDKVTYGSLDDIIQCTPTIQQSIVQLSQKGK